MRLLQILKIYAIIYIHDKYLAISKRRKKDLEKWRNRGAGFSVFSTCVGAILE